MTIVIKNSFNSAFSRLIGNLLEISESEWRQALSKSQFDKVSGIKHAKLHGTPEWNSIGKNASSGCVRMLNQDVIDLYTRVPSKARIVVRT